MIWENIEVSWGFLARKLNIMRAKIYWDNQRYRNQWNYCIYIKL